MREIEKERQKGRERLNKRETEQRKRGRQTVET